VIFTAVFNGDLVFHKRSRYLHTDRTVLTTVNVWTALTAFLHLMESEFFRVDRHDNHQRIIKKCTFNARFCLTL